MSCWFASTCPYSVVLVITINLLSEFLFFWNITSLKSQDVISRNLVFIVITLYRFIVQTFVNVRKSLSSRAKTV